DDEGIRAGLLSDLQTRHARIFCLARDGAEREECDAGRCYLLVAAFHRGSSCELLAGDDPSLVMLAVNSPRRYARSAARALASARFQQRFAISAYLPASVGRF